MNTPNLIQEINQLHANICGALADPSRILILYLLSEGALNVNTLVERLDLPQPTVSRHLKVLRERGLVSAERDGQSVYYSLADHRVIDALDLLRKVLGERLTKQANLANSVTREFTSLN
ncbi:MAG TPA: metalloregulator ArsR/SmtB family transcription factor [Anaerolineales bacterium]|nr:metalloregulator ArsR/SmtB family transcription factor [Anaerolineales bacterium]